MRQVSVHKLTQIVVLMAHDATIGEALRAAQPGKTLTLGGKNKPPYRPYARE